MSKRKHSALQNWSFGHGYVLAMVLIKYSIYDHWGVWQLYASLPSVLLAVFNQIGNYLNQKTILRRFEFSHCLLSQDNSLIHSTNIYWEYITCPPPPLCWF